MELGIEFERDTELLEYPEFEYRELFEYPELEYPRDGVE